MSRRTCKVSEAACLAPAGYQVGGLGGGTAEGSGSCRGTCFACGEPVCANCSTKVIWYRAGRQRVCYSCQEDRAKAPAAAKALERRILTRLQHLVEAR